MLKYNRLQGVRLGVWVSEFSHCIYRLTTGLLIINVGLCSLIPYVICSISCSSHTFLIQMLYVGGSGFSHLIVKDLFAALMSICNKYMLALPSKPSGAAPSHIVSHDLPEMTYVRTWPKNMCVVSPFCSPHFLQHLSELVGAASCYNFPFELPPIN